MTEIDKRHLLDEEVFTYRLSKDGTVAIYWHGNKVTVLSGQQAQKFMAKIVALDGREAQLVMAKATGNFKRGNERRS